MITNVKQIKNTCQSAAIKPTLQRMLILDFLSHCQEHVTVEEIFQGLAPQLPTLSRTTVYNTLGLLLEKGLIEAVAITGSEMRYSVKSTRVHHHFLCTRCGRIYDLGIDCPFMRGEQVAVEGHQIAEIHGYFKGICRDCIQSNP